MSGNQAVHVTYLTIVFEIFFVAEQKDGRTNCSPQHRNPFQQIQCVGKAVHVDDGVCDDVRVRPGDQLVQSLTRLQQRGGRLIIRQQPGSRKGLQPAGDRLSIHSQTGRASDASLPSASNTCPFLSQFLFPTLLLFSYIPVSPMHPLSLLPSLSRPGSPHGDTGNLRVNHMIL